MAGDVLFFFFTSRNKGFQKLSSKLEIIMEKRMLDTCQHKYGL